MMEKRTYFSKIEDVYSNFCRHWDLKNQMSNNQENNNLLALSAAIQTASFLNNANDFYDHSLLYIKSSCESDASLNRNSNTLADLLVAKVFFEESKKMDDMFWAISGISILKSLEENCMDSNGKLLCGINDKKPFQGLSLFPAVKKFALVRGGKKPWNNPSPDLLKPGKEHLLFSLWKEDEPHTLRNIRADTEKKEVNQTLWRLSGQKLGFTTDTTPLPFGSCQEDDSWTLLSLVANAISTSGSW